MPKPSSETVYCYPNYRENNIFVAFIYKTIDFFSRITEAETEKQNLFSFNLFNRKCIASRIFY